MKIIALLPIKNEAATLKECLLSLKAVADQIVIIDDGSSDRSREIAEESGCLVYPNSEVAALGWAEHSIRNNLLSIGRSLGGTHFICLDGDEMLSSNFLNGGRAKISALRPGQRMLMRWVTLWRDETQYISGRSAYTDIWKDFIFCDDGRMSHDYAFLGVGRTPGPAGREIRLPDNQGVVLHFQFVMWKKNQTKQAWYRCCELVKGDRSPRRINNTYAISLENRKIRLKKVPADWVDGLCLPAGLKNASGRFHLEAINKLFDKYGLEFFEPLQIWHIPELKEEFIKKVGREPKSRTFPGWLIALNNLKNKLRNLI